MCLCAHDVLQQMGDEAFETFMVQESSGSSDASLLIEKQCKVVLLWRCVVCCDAR